MKAKSNDEHFCFGGEQGPCEDYLPTTCCPAFAVFREMRLQL